MFALLASLALKSTAVLCAAWLIAAAMRGRSAAARHLVWTSAAAALLSLPFLSAGLPALDIRAPRAAGIVFQSAARAETLTPTPAVTTPATAASGVPLPWSPDWRSWILAVWMAGSALALAQVLAGCARLWRIRRASHLSPEQPLADDLARSLGIRHTVDLFELAEGSMPMTFGILRPAVFLPRDAATWSGERRRMVLLHELAHVRRGDAATQMLARLALALNWWNPLAWFAWREFLKERERATDDLVLAAGARASDYAGLLLDVARSRQSANLGWAAMAMAQPPQLESRLRAILDAGIPRSAAGRASALAAALAAVALVAPFAAVRAQENLPDVEATIRAATAQKNPDLLDKAAAAFEATRKYETARQLLDSAAAIREETAGKQSLAYGIGLTRLGDLERKRNHADLAESFYGRAIEALGERAEAAPGLLYLGLGMLRRNREDAAVDYFQRAMRLDPSQAANATMWIALVREHQSNLAEADALYNSAYALARPDSADAATILELHGRLLGWLGRDAEGRALADRAAAVRKAMAQQQPGSNAARVGNGVMPPSLISKVEPQYTDEARFAKLDGKVIIALEIGVDGLAHNTRIVKGLGLGLEERALDAINQWRFKPGAINGSPVRVQATIEVNFRLM